MATINPYILITLLLVYLCTSFSVYAASFENNECSDSYGNYTKGSVYEKNLNRLFSGLFSHSSSRKFHNSTAGDFPNKVFGLYQCREDMSLKMCEECIHEARQKITQVCPLYGEGIVWYNECMLRYANRSIFSLYETSPTADAWSEDSVSNYDELDPVLTSAMNAIINQASHAIAQGHFAAKTVYWTSVDSADCFAQCTPDIDEFDCKSCLTLTLNEIYSFYNASKMVTIFYPSCQIGYVTQHLSSTHPPPTPVRTKRSHIAIAISVAILVLVLVLLGTGFCIYRHKHRTSLTSKLEFEEIVGAESLQFDFIKIQNATDNFSEYNKQGQGGFGCVYKGKLENGSDIAVKRLSMYSGQGIEEFKTEILLASKLQHNNLVKLFGYCFHNDEKLLVYEFLPNGSLDKVLFGTNMQPLLDWETRYKILLGIARGLLYLHEDSRMKIIHRDLKSSNILLDETMNAKISDFGLARLLDTNQFQADASKIVGSFGYMAPEYALTGRYSIATDVYSFGVIALEIASGQSCSSTKLAHQEENLFVRAWKLWKDGATLNLVDPRLDGNFSSKEVALCIHIGLLCIQEDANMRPTMAPIVSALNNHLVTLPEPEPPVLGPSMINKHVVCNNEHMDVSNNFFGSEDFITEIYPR